MPDKREPLLLLDNSTMYVIGAGDYHSTNLSFEEAKAIIDMYSTEDILRCFTDRHRQVLHDFMGIEPGTSPQAHPLIAGGQDATP
ncbi:MAG: hypothetical protein ACLU8J_04055 [Acutalibacter sp.]